MPGLITHYICAQACGQKINDEQLKNLLLSRRRIYNIGAQGPDVFFYYLPSVFRKSIYQMGATMHKTKISDFFNSIITAIDKIDSARAKSSSIAYLCGYITHYALDSHTHPYIYYKSGFKTDGDGKRKIAHSVNHRNFETNIDVLMLDIVSSEKPSDKKIWEFVNARYAEAMCVSELISGVLMDAYGFKLSKKQVYNAFRSMRFINFILQSKGGRKRSVMEFIENITVKEHVVTSLIHGESDGYDYLNLKNGEWFYPWENKTSFNRAFTDMFDDAVDEAVVMMEKTYDYFRGNVSKNETLDVIGNRSMATGMDSNIPLEFKFHEALMEN
ncbi:MAG: zinc dependent phospholipase C family protein [Clostridiales bacterium]|jgi:hypothetical protein|nr:zinc dependent phospholipase C family protein [Clostridiales bacterium]